MNYRKLLFTNLFVLLGIVSMNAQAIVDVNLNMEHSVDDESRFGRERRMTIHANHTESDWDGHEDMLDYLINDLDVYFGRETGNQTWKMQGVEEDPNKPGWANEQQMITHGQGLKEWYSSEKFDARRQYEAKSNMIQGINDFSPMYPNLATWYPEFGSGKGNWRVRDTDAAADWVGKYFEHYFAHNEGDIGDPLPKYYECYNEPDMNMMNPQFGMIVSSLEKNWEYHKRVAQEIRSRLGDKAPLIGGMCWGLLDLYKQDGVNSRSDGQAWYDGSDPEPCSWYDNMLSGVGSGVPNPGVGHDVWPKAWDNRTDPWWQWDYMYQGFMDYCGADMDFYGVHMYDWPSADVNNNRANTRAGGHIEAMLDMFEWYDHQLYGKKKDIVLSEFGAVSKLYIESLPNGERDWPFIRSFNQMQMQFLERPSHVVYSMPFAPTKAVWGAYEHGGKVVRYEGGTLMEPRGTWTTLATEPSEGWGWGKTIHFFELWKDVEGTRIDTKSDDIDVQVDSYVDGKKVYLILNNAIDENKTINIYSHGAGGNTVESVEFRHLFLGDDNIPAYTVSNMTSAPEQVTLKPNSTIVLVYTYASAVTIDQESVETKYMCKPLTDSKNERGTQLCHTAATNSITAKVNVPSKPTTGEAIIRIGGFHSSPLDGMTGMKITKLRVNTTDVIVSTDNYIHNTRGYGVGSWAGAWFGVIELECPVDALIDGENTIEFVRSGNSEFTTVMIQAFDMTATPGRTTAGGAITAVSLGSAQSVMEGESLALAATFTPANASNKGLSWSSSNTGVATVDENGVVTAVADAGTADITATSTANGTISSTVTITAIPYAASTVSSISINGGDASITVNQYVNTQLSIDFTPAVDVIPVIEWSSNNTDNVEVVNGKIVGKVLNSSATITAKVAGTSITDEITVNVTIPGEESVYLNEVPDHLNPATSYEFELPVLVTGARTVTFELLKGTDVLGTATDNVDKFGLDTANVTITLSTAPAFGTDYSVKAVLKDGATIVDTETKAIEVKAATPVSEVTLNKASISILKGDTKTLSATVYPMDAGNKAVTWSSDAEGVATVVDGVVTGVSAGTANITVTTVDGGHTMSCAVKVVELDPTAASIDVEAEDFASEGGTVDDSQWSGEGLGVRINGDYIDYFNNGDYVIINFTVTNPGTYFMKAVTATPNTGLGIKVTIDGTDNVTTDVPTTGTGDPAWSAFVEYIIPGNVTLAAGSHTLKIEATTDDAWQFNVDKIILIEGDGIDPDVDGNGPVLEAGEEVAEEVVIYPNPADDVMYVSVEAQSKYIVFSTVGQMMLSGETTDDNSIDVSSLPAGLYVIHIQNGNTVVAKQFIKE